MAELKRRFVGCLQLDACDPHEKVNDEEDLPSHAAMYVILRAPGGDVAGEQYDPITTIEPS